MSSANDNITGRLISASWSNLTSLTNTSRVVKTSSNTMVKSRGEMRPCLIGKPPGCSERGSAGPPLISKRNHYCGGL
ncbi:hypothetical protein EVAR_6215_1 [Eumeta japonica]|uniref:Uncharacterized protein n=1 Tax=Eumeta variegata TaxID=151549 RepID=A0A4C1Z400_EUMVA|nr:hypothetical protein EVAR_6215_1 [Eumeta japonica]